MEPRTDGFPRSGSRRSRRGLRATAAAPLLGVIHCVITARDCVMVEARRVSLAFLDEVEYFRRRAARWCEPPVQYRFVREDLPDAEMCRVVARCRSRALETRARRSWPTRRLSAASSERRARETRGRSPRRSHAWCARRARCSAVIPPRTRARRRRTRAWLARGGRLQSAECPPPAFEGHVGVAYGGECLHSRRLARRSRRADALAADERATHFAGAPGRDGRGGRARRALGIGAVAARVCRRLGIRSIVVTDRGQGAGVRSRALVAQRPRWGPASRHRRGSRRRPQSLRARD